MNKNILAVILVLAFSMGSVSVFAAVDNRAGQEEHLASHIWSNSTTGAGLNRSNLAYKKVSTKKWHERIMKILKDMDC